jgi:large subunit ribosomal protein L23
MALFTKKTEKAPVKKEKKIEAKPVVAKASTNKEKRTDFAWGVLKQAHITEKATDLTTHNKYIFEVFPKKNKQEVKNAVEQIYGVDVLAVNMINIPPKKRRMGRIEGLRAGYRKAIVQIKEGQKIELMPR